MKKYNRFFFGKKKTFFDSPDKYWLRYVLIQPFWCIAASGYTDEDTELNNLKKELQTKKALAEKLEKTLADKLQE